MINLDTVSGLVRAVDVFIDVRKLSKQLDIDLINKLLKDASLALGIPCSDDELDAARRDLSAKYCIKSWRNKIETNIERDRRKSLELEQQGWKVIVVWECQLKKNVIHDTLTSLVDEIRRGGQL